MVPFFKTVCLYFVFDAHNHHGEYWSTLLKCAPIISLMLFISLLGISVKSKFVFKKKKQICKKTLLSYVYRFSTSKILVALIFSCLGDALLNHNYFVYGMCAFAVAQLLYIVTFGFEPLNLWIGILLYIPGAASK